MKRRRVPPLSSSSTSPATLATLAGAAVCLSAVSNDAVSGTAGHSVLPNTLGVSELSGKIRVANIDGVTMMVGPLAALVTSAEIAGQGSSAKTFSAGKSCKDPSNWQVSGKAPAGGNNKYIKIRFKEDRTIKYGWSQFRKDGSTFLFGPWSYNNSGGGIKTLADTLTATRLPLAGGNVMLHWTNRHEDGLAAYHLQKQRAAGGWVDVESFVPGTGTYSVVASGHGRFRVVAEQVDGQSTSRDF